MCFFLSNTHANWDLAAFVFCMGKDVAPQFEAASSTLALSVFDMSYIFICIVTVGLDASPCFEALPGVTHALHYMYPRLFNWNSQVITEIAFLPKRPLICGNGWGEAVGFHQKKNPVNSEARTQCEIERHPHLRNRWSIPSWPCVAIMFEIQQRLGSVHTDRVV